MAGNENVPLAEREKWLLDAQTKTTRQERFQEIARDALSIRLIGSINSDSESCEALWKMLSSKDDLNIRESKTTFHNEHEMNTSFCEFSRTDEIDLRLDVEDSPYSFEDFFNIEVMEPTAREKRADKLVLLSEGSKAQCKVDNCSQPLGFVATYAILNSKTCSIEEAGTIPGGGRIRVNSSYANNSVTTSYDRTDDFYLLAEILGQSVLISTSGYSSSRDSYDIHLLSMDAVKVAENFSCFFRKGDVR